jgi:hypothetical protein
MNLKLNIGDVKKNHNLESRGKAQKYIDSEVLRLCEPYVPKDQDTLIKSGITNTVIGSGTVKWKTPYARKWYYTPANFQGAPMRGNYWGQRAMKNGGLLSIKRGLNQVIK